MCRHQGGPSFNASTLVWFAVIAFRLSGRVLLPGSAWSAAIGWLLVLEVWIFARLVIFSSILIGQLLGSGF